MNLDQKTRIRELNDAFRQSFHGGQVMLTTGVQSLGGGEQAILLTRVRRFEEFEAGNDPHQEHDFGSVEKSEGVTSTSGRSTTTIASCIVDRGGPRVILTKRRAC